MRHMHFPHPNYASHLHVLTESWPVKMIIKYQEKIRKKKSELIL